MKGKSGLRAIDAARFSSYHPLHMKARFAMRVFLVMFFAAFAACARAEFAAAKPVWPAGREKQMNSFAGFYAEVEGPEKAIVRFTGSSICRLFVNGEFIGYGPARGPHGFDRIDEWPVSLKPGANSIAIEVAGYNVNAWYLLDEPAYLQAEVVAGDRILAATGSGFSALSLPHKIKKIQRYSPQRAFAEAWRLTPDSDAWRTGAPFQPLVLAEQPQQKFLPRIAPYPDFKLLRPVKEIAGGSVKTVPGRDVWMDKATWLTPSLKGYYTGEQEASPFFEVQRMEFLPADPALPDTWRTFDFASNRTGFIGGTLRCETPCRVYFAFDEILTRGDVSVTRMRCANVVGYELTQPGTYRVEAFEPYTLRYLKVITTGGSCAVSGLYLREYANPAATRAAFASSDPDLGRIFEAARETFRQNAVDVFTDCPSRERAAWLCDSFFTSRVALDLCGDTDMERLFFQNYLLPESFRFLPQGMLPMCYPADHNECSFIPNWAMWFVIQLEEYLARSGDRATIEALRPRVLALLDFLSKYKNSDGLLEKLPSWVFIEWSRSNELVQDVSYPSNMTYAEALSCAARLYRLPELEAEAQTIRETIRKQSFNGAFFVDNATRRPDGSLAIGTEATETCQYYAFFFRTATPALYPRLWKTLVDDFGPRRRHANKHPAIAFSNAFIGNYLRLELLSREGLAAQILAESKGYFLHMVDQTGTLWENDSPSDSCCHGFASHAAHILYRDVLGVAAIDPVNKKITLRFNDVPLESCSGTIPIGKEALTVAWRKKDGKLIHTVEAPPGFTVIEP